MNKSGRNPGEYSIERAFLAPQDFIRYAGSVAARAPGWEEGDPHLSLDWFCLLAETAIPPATRLGLLPCTDPDGETQSFLPVMIERDSPRCLAALATCYTPFFGMVGGSAASPGQMLRLARELRQGNKRFAEVSLSPMDPESDDFLRIGKALREAGWLVDDYYCFGNWFHSVETGGFAGYLAARPGKLRTTLKRAERRLEKLEGYSLRIIQGCEPDFLTAIAEYVDVYTKSWKEPEPWPQFIPGLCALAARHGSLRLGLIGIGGQTIAAQLWLVVAGKAHIVKLAYDPAFAQFSPGTVLTAALCRHVIDNDQVQEIDYLIGDDAYKQDWMSKRRERRGIVAFNPRTLNGLLGGIRHFLGKYAKAIFK